MSYSQTVILIFAAIFIVACARASTSTPQLTIVGSPVPLTGTPTSPSVELPGSRPTYTMTDAPTSQSATGETQIRVIIGEAVLTGRLWNNATARDLISQLPLTLIFSDFNEQEKLAALPRKLSLDGAPKGDSASPREIGYYAPSGHLVFYYTDVGYFNGIVRIGQFDGSMDAVTSQTRDFTARIELSE